MPRPFAAKTAVFAAKPGRERFFRRKFAIFGKKRFENNVLNAKVYPVHIARPFSGGGVMPFLKGFFNF